MARKPVQVTQDFPQPEEDDAADFIPVSKAQPNQTFLEVAARFGKFRPAREVLTKVKAVPTRFIQLDHATKVGGLPIERFMVVHGPSGHGKTAFCLGLGHSFLEREHFFSLVDAEITTPETWLETLLGEYLDSPLFGALRPNSYEETVDSVRDMLKAIQKAKKEGTLDQKTSGLVVVDSLRKLVPEGILKKITDGKGGVDGMGGRAAQIKAAMNAAWLDELVPALYHSGCAMIVIARESENTDAGMFDKDWKMTGGKAIEYDSSLIMRIDRHGWVKMGDSDDAKVIGERHRITIRKTKIAAQDNKQTVCYFHTSNGQFAPEGFDRPRDVLELAVRFKIVGKSGSWLLWNGQRIQGSNQFVRKLHDNSAMMNELETAVRAAFTDNDPEEETDE